MCSALTKIEMKDLEISNLNSIKPWKSTWRLHVKVTHAWKGGNSQYGETIDFIFMDEQGTKMHGSMRAGEIKRVGDEFMKLGWKDIKNISVKNATGAYRPTRHPFRVFIQSNTKVSDLTPIAEIEEPVVLTPFAAILNPYCNKNFLVDVIGQVINVGEMETIEANNKPTKKIDILLRDIENEVLKVTLWGPYADQIWKGCNDVGNGQVICFIQYAKVKTWDEQNYLSNAFNATKIEVNPNIAEVVEFAKRLPNDEIILNLNNAIQEKEGVVVVKESFLNYPLLNIEQIHQSGEVGKSRVICTIQALDCDYGWYVFYCKTCNRPTEWKENPADLKKKEAWFCEKCQKFVKQLVPRYNLYVLVADETSQMKCLLFDSNATKIVTQSAAKLLNGSTAPIADPTNLPQAIRNIVGTTWQLCVSIDNDNLQDTTSTYKVLKVWPPNQMAGESEFQSSDGNNGVDASSLMGTEQAPLLITASDDKSESVMSDTTTPSSKRKEDCGISAPDQLSTSSKMSCFKKIKVEGEVAKFNTDLEEDAPKEKKE